jgi:hypothetical protein
MAGTNQPNCSRTRPNAHSITDGTVKWVMRLVFIDMSAEQGKVTQMMALVSGILASIPNRDRSGAAHGVKTQSDGFNRADGPAHEGQASAARSY